ncbi:GM11587 [Drosophila sechellia]|uniref:GM11587 n=1 Tax=Drosophila sechellia TaxID=7238 RepID=B4IGJ8_DROSE|nr:GM11587 [Drosophila sechellia]
MRRHGRPPAAIFEDAANVVVGGATRVGIPTRNSQRQINPRFHHERLALEAIAGARLTAESLVPLMMDIPRIWEG